MLTKIVFRNKFFKHRIWARYIKLKILCVFSSYLTNFCNSTARMHWKLIWKRGRWLCYGRRTYLHHQYCLSNKCFWNVFFLHFFKIVLSKAIQVILFAMNEAMSDADGSSRVSFINCWKGRTDIKTNWSSDWSPLFYYHDYFNASKAPMA